MDTSILFIMERLRYGHLTFGLRKKLERNQWSAKYADLDVWGEEKDAMASTKIIL